MYNILPKKTNTCNYNKWSAIGKNALSISNPGVISAGN